MSSLCQIFKKKKPTPKQIKDNHKQVNRLISKLYLYLENKQRNSLGQAASHRTSGKEWRHYRLSQLCVGMCVGGCCWYLVGRGQGFAKYPTMHRTAQHRLQLPVVLRLKGPARFKNQGNDILFFQVPGILEKELFLLYFPASWIKIKCA